MIAEQQIREIYKRYRDGNGITDTELEQLLDAIEGALPFLAASPAFSLVYREARTDRVALEGYRRARQERRPPPVESGVPPEGA